MGYVAAKGGFDAIRSAEDLVRRHRMEARSSWLEIDQIIERLGYAVDRVMGEGALWDPESSAIAFRQAEGDVVEAAHIVRAYRSTLPRLGYAELVDADEIDVLRRIVPAFREPPGPQLLGRTPDYTGRLLERSPEDEARRQAALAAAEAAEAAAAAQADEGSVDDDPSDGTDTGCDTSTGAGSASARVPGRLMDVLRSMDLLVDRRRDDDPPAADISRVPARPGAPRSARLSAMARAETGALVQLWYRNILGPDRNIHEVTLGEVRHGRLPIRVEHPHLARPVTVGHVRVTEVEAIEDLDGNDEDRTRFDIGYGLCLGHNEKKAIAMANLDIALHRDLGLGEDAGPLEQSVLMTTDGLDASGFLEHLKLPHYVTFRSMVERKRAMAPATDEAGAAEPEAVETAGAEFVDTTSGPPPESNEVSV
jgi:alpha-D-ribose 1-methylphosphonate 5-triphosphate synthase subunit PhnI